MNEVYVVVKDLDLSSRVEKRLPKKDLISVQELINALDDACYEISCLEEQIEEMEQNETGYDDYYYDAYRDSEMESE